jgi:hypothetical protein
MRSRSGRAEVGADGCPDSESSQMWQTSRTATEKKSATSLGTAQRTRRQLRAVPDEAEDPWRRLWGAKRRRSGCADNCAQTAATPAASLARQRILPGESDAQTAANADGRADGGTQIRRTTADGAQDGAQTAADEADGGAQIRRTTQRMAEDGAQTAADEADRGGPRRRTRRRTGKGRAATAAGQGGRDGGRAGKPRRRQEKKP